MSDRRYLTITIDLYKLGGRLRSKGYWVRVKDLAYEMGISTKTAGRILAALEKLGYVRRRGNGVYKIIA